MPTVTFENHGKQICVGPDTTVLQAARQLGIELAAPCGGNGTCGKCRVTANGKEVLACQTRVDADMAVELPQQTRANILTSGQTTDLPVDPVQPGYLLAFDIGTTTVVCFLLSPEGRELAVESMLNPQASYGADVISRIQCALAGEMDALTRAIRRGMSDLIGKCCEKTGIDPSQVGVISVVGNPCMQQLFLGIAPSNLAAVPFAPVLKSAIPESAAVIFPECSNAVLLTIPDISGYVGADTIGCVLASKMYKAEDTTLMVDIGTNGEMVLAHGGRMVACSTAAGPALEGANITFGMRGSTGAIDHVWTENGHIRYSVIGNCESVGICGSGIIDAVAALLDLKLVNKRGRIQTTEELDGQRVIHLSENIYLTQEDIRQIQMAKGAIAAGIHLMCAYLGITPAEIQRVILAGAFGSFLNPESACRMELLPKELSGKITAAGNLAGVGAKMTAMNKEQFAFTEELRKHIEFIELADMPAFQKTFAKCMTLPQDSQE